MEEYMKEHMEEYMKEHMSEYKEETIKALNFDLNVKKLEEYYCKGDEHRKYTDAYREIGAYLHKHGFSHRQGSGYLSNEPMEEHDVSLIVAEFSKQHDWFAHCVKVFDLTEVGETFSLMDVIYDSNSSYKKSHPQIEAETEESDSIKSHTSKEQNPYKKKAKMKNKGMDYGD